MEQNSHFTVMETTRVVNTDSDCNIQMQGCKENTQQLSHSKPVYKRGARRDLSLVN